MLALLGRRVKRMDLLIDGILQYSRVGRVEEKKETIQLNSLVKDIITSLAAPEFYLQQEPHQLPQFHTIYFYHSTPSAV